MTEQTFDALTRRASLLTLGAGMAALGGPLAAAAKKNKNKNKKIKKKARKKCQNQVPQCEAEVIAACEGNQDCLDDQLPCCPLVGDCNLTAFFGCIAA